MALASGSIDLKAIEKGATKYITDIGTDGIYISPANQSPVNNREGNSIKLTGRGLEVFQNNQSVALYGTTARIGIDGNNYSNVQISNDAITMYNRGIETYTVQNSTGRKINLLIPLHSLISSGQPSYTQTIELGRAVKSWINSNGIRGIVFIYSIDGVETIKSYNGPTVSDTSGSCAIETSINAKKTQMTVTFSQGSTYTDEIIDLVSIEFNFVSLEPVVQTTIGAYIDTKLAGPFKVGVGTSNSNRKNAMLVDYQGNARIAGDLLLKCNDDSTEGVSLGTIKTYVVDCNISGYSSFYIYVCQIGYVVTLTIQFIKTASTAAGADLFKLYVADKHIPKPAGDTVGILPSGMRPSGFGYAGKFPLGFWFGYSDGFWYIAARNLSTSATTANMGVSASLTYITDGTYTDEY